LVHHAALIQRFFVENPLCLDVTCSLSQPVCFVFRLLPVVVGAVKKLSLTSRGQALQSLNYIALHSSRNRDRVLRFAPGFATALFSVLLEIPFYASLDDPDIADQATYAINFFVIVLIQAITNAQDVTPILQTVLTAAIDYDGWGPRTSGLIRLFAFLSLF
jgi:hypothetical protein